MKFSLQLVVDGRRSDDRVIADTSARSRRSEGESGGHGGDGGRDSKNGILESDVELLDLAVDSLDGLVKATGSGSGREDRGHLDVTGDVPEVRRCASGIRRQQARSTEGGGSSVGIGGDKWRLRIIDRTTRCL